MNINLESWGQINQGTATGRNYSCYMHNMSTENTFTEAHYSLWSQLTGTYKIIAIRCNFQHNMPSLLLKHQKA
jgi:hypothetical protein